MEITINIYYKGQNGNAISFAREMITSGIVDEIRSKKGNLKYEYFIPLEDSETVLLIDKWDNQESLDLHHHSSVMQKIISLREKYDLTMRVERYTKEDNLKSDEKYIRK